MVSYCLVCFHHVHRNNFYVIRRAAASSQQQNCLTMNLTCSVVLSYLSGAMKDNHVLSKMPANPEPQTDRKPSKLLGLCAALLPLLLDFFGKRTHKMQTQVIATDLTSIPCDYKEAECRVQQREKNGL